MARKRQYRPRMMPRVMQRTRQYPNWSSSAMVSPVDVPKAKVKNTVSQKKTWTWDRESYDNC